MNLSNLSMFNSDICLSSQGAYSAACLYKHLCPQIPVYFKTYGIAILASSMIVITIIFLLRKLKRYAPQIEDINIPLGFFYIYFPLDFSQDKTIDWWQDYSSEMIMAAMSIYIFIVLFWAFAQ